MEDELLNFLVIKMKTLNHDDIVLLASNNFNSEWIEASKKILFELCPQTTQRCVTHKGAQKDTNNIKACLKVLNECGENIPRFVSHYLDDLPPVSYDHINVSALLGRLEQLNKDMCCVKKTLEAQTDACEGLRVTTMAIDDWVSAIEKPCGSTGVVPGAGYVRPCNQAWPAAVCADQEVTVAGGGSSSSVGSVSTPQPPKSPLWSRVVKEGHRSKVTPAHKPAARQRGMQTGEEENRYSWN